MRYLQFIFIIIIIFILGCGGNYSPKPHGYFKIDFPEKSYVKYINNYPYTFYYQETSSIEDLNKDSAWININYPAYNAIIYITYKKVNNNLATYLEETRNFVYRHTLKADAISETPYINPERNIYGLIYDIKGNAASSINFFVTDSINHFLRGALYFNTVPNKDSLAPVISYIREDIIYLIESFEWK